jgi:hypothetical protein
MYSLAELEQTILSFLLLALSVSARSSSVEGDIMGLLLRPCEKRSLGPCVVVVSCVLATVASRPRLNLVNE